MKLAAISLLMLLGAAASGCATDPRDINREPALTAVGSGLLADRVPVPSETTAYRLQTGQLDLAGWQRRSLSRSEGAQDRRR